ncbi:hypothetical protein KR067_012987, partial [Drosophila pandora]
PMVAATEEQNIACSLEEARKKLAALRGGAPGGATNGQPEQPMLAPSPNDPRLRKHYSPQSPSNIINNNNNNSNNNNIIVPLLPQAIMRTPSPIPPPPSMKPSNWISFSNIPVNVSPTAPGNQPPFRSFERDSMPQTQTQAQHQRYNGVESRDPRSRPPHQTAPHQQQQQPYASMAAYSGNQRRPANSFNGFDDANWHSGQNGNGSGFSAPSWNGQTNGTASGFNGSGSFRGNSSYPRGAGRGGGHPNRHYVRPGMPGALGGDVPRTYKEHREAKARADAMAKAKAEEELRRLEVERQRLLEAADKGDAGKERELGAAATAVPELQLDTSYRNCAVLNGPAKKIDFRIPKKTPAPATTPTSNPVSGEADGGMAGNSNKACDAKKDRDKETINNSKNTDNNKSKNKDNANENEDVEREADERETGKGSKKKTNKNKPQKEPEKKSSKRKRNRKRNKKNTERDAEKKVPPSGNRDFGDVESVVSLGSSENTDNLENEPPVPENNASPTTELPQEAQSQNEASEDDDDIFGRVLTFRKKTTSVSEGKPASEDKNVPAKDAEEREEEDNKEESTTDKTTAVTDEDKPPKLSKMKIVLGPNAHTVIMPNDHSDSKDMKEGKSALMVFDEDHDDEEVPGPTVQELKRIMQRRNSMAPTASKPLVDKELLFTGRSLVYEDLQEQHHTNQQQRNLANLFERTSDNCRVSTQNIISGKRRTRGGQENFNETHLSRNIFGLGQITRAKRGEAVRKATSKEDVRKTDDNKSAKSIISSPGNRKRRRKTSVPEASVTTENDVPEEKPAGDINEDQDSVVKKKEELLEVEVAEKHEPESEAESDPSKKPRLDLEVVKISALGEVQKDQTAVPASNGRQKPRKKRNELDKLNEDIAQMYYGEEVLRATGRRACTKRPPARARTRTRSRTLSSARSSSSQPVSPSRADTDSTAVVSPQSSKDDRLSSPFFIRNMARRGRAFGGPRSLTGGINRVASKSKLPKLKNVRVRIARCLPLEKMIKQQKSVGPTSPKDKSQEETPQTESNTAQTSPKEKPAKKKKLPNKGIKNVNPEWHAQSAAVSSCVICKVAIRQSPTLHYLLKHQEHFAARLSPEMLQELRNGRNSKPDYKMHKGAQKGMFYHFVCPFCMKPLMMRPAALADHLAYHMGEARFSCSHCRMPNRNRIAQLTAHTRNCAPGAQPLINPSVSRIPLNIHVCHLCQYVQIEKKHLDIHLTDQHGLTKEEVEDLEVEQLTICRVDDVPLVSSPAEANAVLRKNQNEGGSSKTGEKSGKKKKRDKGKKAEQVKQERVEQETQSEPEDEQESSTHTAKVEVCTDGPDLQLPLPPPEKETVLVVNECLMDVDEDSTAEEEVQVEVEAEAEPSQQNMSLTVDQKPVMLIDNRILEEEAAPPPSKSTKRDQPAPPPDISLSELNGDLLDGIGSDESDIEDPPAKASVVLGKSNEDDDEGALTDEWVDLETANEISRSRKSIFYNFNRLCTILNKGGNNARSGGRGGTSIGSNDTSSDVLEVETEHNPDPSELLPSMKPLEPPETETILQETPIEVPDPASVDPSSAKTPPPTVASVSGRGPVPAPPKRQVENVAFRTWSAGGSDLNRRAYYCMQPGCTFLFSSELVGLEAHFMLEHPTIQWSGTCVSCPGRQEASLSPLTIVEELRHMLQHISGKSPSKEAAAPVEAAPEPEPVTLEPVLQSVSDPVPPEDSTPAAVVQDTSVVPAPLPKLRVRRFTGDRLIEPVAAGEEVATEVVAPQLDSQDAVSNLTLRDLLLAEPRPPNQTDLNAAGMGEFLVAKPTTPPQVLQGVEPIATHPVVINYQSGLGLSISQVYSGAQVTLPGDSHPPVEAEAPAIVPPLPAPMVEPNQFRCMSPGCGFCTDTVLSMQQHLKYHKFKGTGTEYLVCGYCDHPATDIADYLDHAVFIHGLAARLELEQLPGPESVSQQIRNVFNQRRNQRLSISTAPSTEPLATSSTESSQRPLAISSIETSLLSSPLALCIVRLTEDQFVNHVLFHLRSSSCASIHVKCKFCSLQAPPQILRTHLQQAHAPHRFLCSQCLATTTTERLMIHHVRHTHPVHFERQYRQVQFIQLPGVEVATKNGSRSTGTGATEYFLAAVEQPFGSAQMHEFHLKLCTESSIRRQGTKTRFRSSESALLPRRLIYLERMHCAECSFSSVVRTLLIKHLADHREEALRLAYQNEPVPAPEPVAPFYQAQPPETQPPLPTTVLPATPVVETPSPIPLKKITTPKPQVTELPEYTYVPRNIRFRCGFITCDQVLSNEEKLRKHMTDEHMYSDILICPHCSVRLTGTVSVERYLQHLLFHKRHIFQCGACPRFNPRRSIIERHVQFRHLEGENREVAVLVHQRSLPAQSERNGLVVTRIKWLRTPKLAHPARMEYTCNLCQLLFPSSVQVMAHALTEHSLGYMFHCPECNHGSRDAANITNHILRKHPERPMQLLQVFHRIVGKNKQTLGFYCTICREAASNFQKMSSHCETVHKTRLQWKCYHCDFANSQERHVITHMEEKHPGQTGLAQLLFDRVVNHIPDRISWNMGTALEESTEKREAAAPLALPALPTNEPTLEPRSEGHIITEVVDLLASDDEVEEIGECQEDTTVAEFACTHCEETNSNLQDLRTQHWAKMHPELPFYFRVQPQLLCSECKRFKGNARTLRDDHLVKEHMQRNIVACDVRRPEECAYCNYRYTNRQDLMQHIQKEGHLPNDLKNVTDAELDALQQLSSCGAASNEYYQCDLCSVVMPTMSAIAQHGCVEHSKPGERFCFRKLTGLIFHCFYCIFTSTNELATLRHMLDHYNRFLFCHFCKAGQSGYDQYLQHCFDYHGTDLPQFRALHPYTDLRNYLMQVHYQFQNGLIITKSSLRNTRYNYDYVMMALDRELMSKMHVLLAPRPTIHIKEAVGVRHQQQLPMQQQQKSSFKIIARRKTVDARLADGLSRVVRELPQPPQS